MVKAAVVDPVALAYHELRSPLGLVITAARSAAEECPQDYEVLRMRCQAIARAAERMLVTAQEILAMSAVAGADCRDDFDLSSSLASAVAEFQALGVRLAPGSFPSFPRVQGSRTKFETLIMSLLNNALEHGAPGADVEVRAWNEAGEAVVEIRNPIAPLDHHRGYRLGSRIAEELARGLRAGLQADAVNGVYRVTVRLPLAPRVALAS